MSHQPHAVSFRRSLLRNLLLLILGLAGALIAVSFIGNQIVAARYCRERVDSATDQVNGELRCHLGVVPDLLLAAREWTDSGVISRFDQGTLGRVFIGLIEHQSFISGMSAGDAEGSSYSLFKRDGGWSVRTTQPDSVGRLAAWTELDGSGKVRRRWEEASDYDPRTRPWYQMATAPETPPGTIHWTEAYRFFTSQEMGVTAAVAVQSPGGAPFVVALDVTLLDISRFTTRLPISARGFALVLAPGGRVIALPRHPLFTTDAQIRGGIGKMPKELGVPTLETAAALYSHRRANQRSDEDKLAALTAPQRWRSGGEAWYGRIASCPIANGPALWTVVVAPENDFLREFRQYRLYLIAVAALALATAIAVALLLAKRYAQPLKALTRQSQQLRHLDTGEGVPVRTGIREIATLHEAQESMRLALDSFARYVPAEVVRKLLDRGEAAVIGGHDATLTIMFTDIEGFTAIAETMTPRELTAHMADYFDLLLGAIAACGGTVDKLIGDAVMAFWGAPADNPAHAIDALRATVAARDGLAAQNARWVAAGLPALPTRFGIATGEVVVGNVGATRRLTYTVLGDAVNLAARLETANGIYGTRNLVSAATVHAAGDHFVFRRIDRVRVKGRREPELIHELLGPAGAVAAADLAFARRYEEALAAYWDRRFPAAAALLDELLAARPDEPSAARLLASARALADAPPPADWDGVSQLTTKR